VDEFPEVTFYVLNEPALTAPAPDEFSIWQEMAHLRTENFRWRECVQGIVVDSQQHASVAGLREAIHGRVVSLADKLARRDHR
jgi:hypothetical protein